MVPCSEGFVWVGREAGASPTFSLVVNQEVREVRVSVAYDRVTLGSVTYHPAFRDADLDDACEPCREAPRGVLSITAEGEVVKG